MSDEEFGESVTPSNPAGFIKYQITIGQSARGALDEWRDLGGTTADAKWYRLYGQVEDTLARTPDHAALEPDQLPSPSDYSTWAAGQGGQYATQVKVTYIDDETGVQSERDYTHFSNEPHTPAEAEQAGIAEYGGEDNEDKYGQKITGAYAIHIWQTVPFN